MERRYKVGGYEVIVELNEGLVRIVNNDAFKHAVAVQSTNSVASLIGSIQADYITGYGTSLAIGDNSFAVEIWGHLYFEYFLLKYNKLLRIIFLFGLYKRFLRSCQVFDCGEAGKDPNRWVWDRLARYRRTIESWLPKIHSWLIDR
ncbi:MAG: hypothetical protein EAS52_09540 [Parapedobacter sp.]|nr:MAG: hypothetical protein EAS52_09540 [Parapedobacter sp.]